MSGQLKDKAGEPIHEGDPVETKIRGGTHTGTVDKIVTSQEEAQEENVKNPPKVTSQAVVVWMRSS
ncbi:predicted protein [Uncinocarpus reesii 1704]|uniref:Hypervirulence associated protein TUDOR domain-containing protein n=1 Tax=Uncinocarpus reesii (strain UAMH 1704) TaxID=336963 RepID=C4JQ07_UNCRE|nr:uncharacterized protein UREG_03240 [Uncinocarpus reesii 1704]EEP78394.1 predicted protein [Uncinocarpus reesii 1704]